MAININLNNVQEKLVSGTNIKTVNGTSLVGSGNISTASGFQGTIVIADTPTTDGIYRPTEEGTYTNAGGLTYLPSTTDEGFQVEFILTGGSWVKSRVDVGVSVASIVEENNPNPVSSEAVEAYAMEFDKFADIVKGKNLFDEAEIVSGIIINSTTGDLSPNPNPDWKISGYIPVEPNTQYTISHEVRRRGVSFFTDKIDTSIPGSFNGSSSSIVTVTSPANAVYMVIGVTEPSVPNYSKIQVEKGSVATGYEPYQEVYKIKESALPTAGGSSDASDFEIKLDETGESYVKTVIDGKELKQVIRPFESGKVFDFSIVYFDGVHVKTAIDDTAPYRIDGSVIGANHQPENNLNRVQEFFIDGNKITDLNKNYHPRTSLTIKEYYDIDGVNTSGIVAKVSMSYVFDKYGGCTIYTDFLAEQPVPIQNIMFTQAACMVGDVNYYIPKTLPIVQDGVTYDFSAPYNMTSFAPINKLYITKSDCEPTGILPDRVVMLRNDIGFVHGYLPVQDTAVGDRRINVDDIAIEIRNNTKKSYPNAIDAPSGKILNVGEYYSTIAYRRYFVPQGNTTVSYFIPSNAGTFVYLDWHTTTTDRISLPDELSGKPYELVEKSDSVSILSKENTGTMVFDVVSKGYAILKFN